MIAVYSPYGASMLFKFLSLSVFLSFIPIVAFADLVELDSSDPLELLVNESLTFDQEQSDNPYSIVSAKDYKQLNIQPLYTDSIVKLHKDSSLVEEKLFPNDIYMSHFIGLNFVVFRDLSSYEPTESKWTVTCSVDKITDAKQCVLSNSLNIFYFKLSDEPSFLGLGEGREVDFSRPSYLRIDKNKPFKVNKLVFKRPILDNILKEMTLGKTIYLRYHKKYKESSYDAEVSLKGFSNAYNTLNILYLKVK